MRNFAGGDQIRKHESQRAWERDGLSGIIHQTTALRHKTGRPSYGRGTDVANSRRRNSYYSGIADHTAIVERLRPGRRRVTHTSVGSRHRKIPEGSNGFHHTNCLVHKVATVDIRRVRRLEPGSQMQQRQPRESEWKSEQFSSHGLL